MVADTLLRRDGAIALHAAPDEQALADLVAARFAQAVLAAVQARGHAVVVVTGGTTPRAYYPRIAALDLPWSSVTLTLSDERWVAPDHPESNERLLRELLLVGPARSARLVALKNEAADPFTGCPASATALRALPHPYDLVLLGLGSDTHVASLFPGATQFDVGVTTRDPCFAVTPPPWIKPALPRLSLSLHELLDSRHVVIAARGLDKRDAYTQAMAGRWPQPSPLPLLAQRAHQPVEFIWTA